MHAKNYIRICVYTIFDLDVAIILMLYLYITQENGCVVIPKNCNTLEELSHIPLVLVPAISYFSMS